jgi:RNA polymerase-binding transcription factor DksA
MPSALHPPREQFAAERRRLLERSAVVRADIARELRNHDAEQYSELAGLVSDSGDQSVADLLVDIGLAEVTRDVGEVRDIEAALLRIARGVYGTCIDCDRDVGRARLEINASAARCIPCQERYEGRDREERHRTL